VGYTGSITLTITTGNPTQESLALLLKENLKNLANIDVNIDEIDNPTYLTRYHQFNIPISTGGWLQDIDDPAPFVGNFATYAGFRARNAMFGTNQTIIAMVNKAASSLDPNERASLYREIQLEMLRKMPYVDIAQPVAIFAERDWVLPSDSCAGRSVCYALSGDGDGGVTGGYSHAYYVWKASTTSQINIEIQPYLGMTSQYIALAAATPSKFWLSSVSRFA
jgi:ABC-type transport system substrate-binding protein